MMKTNIRIAITILVCLFLLSYSSKYDQDKTIVEMTTNYGTMVIELHNETPLHRDNFIKLVNDKAYDSLLFHRVIETFMIQGGDPDSKNAKLGDFLGEGDLEYSVNAEFKPDLFHKKGALSTARVESLGRVSSAMQFFIVQGKVYNDSLLEVADSRINKMLARHYFLNQPENEALWTAFKKAEDDENQFMILNDSINNMVKYFTDFKTYRIPQTQREVYKTIGGTPHLDQNYTVFGQVIEGLDIIDSMAKVKTDKWDRPVKNVIIKSVRIR
ncbi:peptidylprolyl isomerase [Psychroserpens ponticola]|uniref:peptidylprolyl isomerase n=1 Tax=Psychroserpens ponticola TaxID=2932268 RepID=A0ABY7S1S5_9FLAO|nr:peptidylprolyl isomerase [Psychroserpens ponticola]WCO02960.1 peptidylprolyl isomerase [Psychroserpens ponticola]